MVIRTNQVIRPSLGGRIGAVRGVGSFFRKKAGPRDLGFRRPHPLKRGESGNPFSGCLRRDAPCMPRAGEGSQYVGLYKRLGTIDGAVDVTLRGKVDQCIGFRFLKNGGDQFGISYVAEHKFVTGVSCKLHKVLRIARIGLLVEVKHPFAKPGV